MRKKKDREALRQAIGTVKYAITAHELEDAKALAERAIRKLDKSSQDDLFIAKKLLECALGLVMRLEDGRRLTPSHWWGFLNDVLHYFPDVEPREYPDCMGDRHPNGCTEGDCPVHGPEREGLAVEEPTNA